MRKSLLSLALIVASYASAGDKQPYHVNIHSGITVFDDANHLENGSLVGASVAFYERETLSYALQLGYERLNGIAYEGIVLDTDIDRYYMNMIVDGEEELNITPYILLGGGYENLSRVYEEYADTKSQAFINAGLGFKYALNDYFNITLEGRALGKLDSESIDYVGKLGLDFMFGGKWDKKAPMLEALGKSKVIEKAKVKPPLKEVKKEKKKKWITSEVVEEMFAEKDQERVDTKPLSLAEDASVVKIQESLKSLKIQMAQREALLADKLAKLEIELVEKTKQREQKRLLSLQAEAEAKHLENMRITQAKIVKAEAMAKALEKKKKVKQMQERSNEKARMRHLAVMKHLNDEKRVEAKRFNVAKKEAANKKRLEKIKIAKEKANQKRIAQEKRRVAQKRRVAEQRRVAVEIKAAKVEAERVAKAARVVQKPIEFNDMKENVIIREKNLKVKVARKIKTESVDKLLIRNGMVVFAD